MKKLDVLETIIRIYDPSYTFKCLDEIFFFLKFVILKMDTSLFYLYVFQKKRIILIKRLFEQKKILTNWFKRFGMNWGILLI